MRPLLGLHNYVGTPEGFIAALPGYLKAAAETRNLRASDYDTELAYIDKTLRVCASVTQAEKNTIQPQTSMFLDLSKLGGKYKSCSVNKIDATKEAHVSHSGPHLLFQIPYVLRRGDSLKMNLAFGELSSTDTAPIGNKNSNAQVIVIAVLN
jgi:hypothetical protein